MRVIGTLLVGTLCVTHVVAAASFQNLPDHDTPSSDFRNAPSGCLRPPPHGPRSRNPSDYSVMYNSDTSPSPTCSSSNHPNVTRPAMSRRRSRGKGHRGSRSDTSASPVPAMTRENSSNGERRHKKKKSKKLLSTTLFKKIQDSVFATLGNKERTNYQKISNCDTMKDYFKFLHKECKEWLHDELENDSSRLRQDMDSWMKEKIQKKIKKTIKKILKQQKEKKIKQQKEKSLRELQLDLFIMTTTTVFRNLEEEGQFKITPEIRQKFDPPVMYEEALNKDIPWRQWNAWLRNRIVTHLKGNVARRRLSSSTSRGVLQRLRRTRLRR